MPIKNSAASILRHVALLIALVTPAVTVSGTTYIERHLAEVRNVNHRIGIVYFPYEVGDVLRAHEAKLRKFANEDTAHLVGEKTKALLRSRGIEIDANSPLVFSVSFSFEFVACGEEPRIVILVKAYLAERVLLARNVLGSQEAMTQTSWSTEHMVVVDRKDLYQTIEDEAISLTERFISKVEQAKQFYLKENPKVE